jgi:hypothetical protein
MTTKQDEPKIYVNVYGSDPPKAARFAVGATTLAEVRDACQKARDQKPGDHEK